MYLTHLSPLSPLPFPSKKSQSLSSSKAISFLFLTFEETVLLRLKSLIPNPSHSPAISLSYLSRAVDVLTSTHADAQILISDPSLSGSDSSALSSYVDTSIRLLDACNAISSEIERLHRGRLLIVFAVHLLSSSADDLGQPTPEKIRKARDSILEWQALPKGNIAAAGELIRDLALREPPRGKISAVERAIYAVEAVSALVAGVVVAFLGGKGDFPLEIKVGGEFAWAGAFSNLHKALAGEIRSRSPGDFEAVENCIRELTDVIDGEKTGSLRSAVKEVESAVAKLTEGLDRLGSAVNGLFRVALCTRNIVLHRFRVGPQKCK